MEKHFTISEEDLELFFFAGSDVGEGLLKQVFEDYFEERKEAE